MAWLKIDDGFHEHPKVLAAGLFGKALWYAAAGWCAKQLTDGFVPLVALDLIYTYAQLPAGEGPLAVQRLVQVGLWEESSGEPGYVFHNWLSYQPSKDEVEYRRSRDRRKAELHSKRCDWLRQAVRARDGDVCRYCTRTVLWARPGASTELGGTYDHVDPALANTVENVVVACRGCNGRKKNRTPQQAGMVLHPVGRSEHAPEPSPATAGDQNDGTLPADRQADADLPGGAGVRRAAPKPRRRRAQPVPVPPVPVVARGAQPRPKPPRPAAPHTSQAKPVKRGSVRTSNGPPSNAG